MVESDDTFTLIKAADNSLLLITADLDLTEGPVDLFIIKSDIRIEQNQRMVFETTSSSDISIEEISKARTVKILSYYTEEDFRLFEDVTVHLQ